MQAVVCGGLNVAFHHDILNIFALSKKRNFWRLFFNQIKT